MVRTSAFNRWVHRRAGDPSFGSTDPLIGIEGFHLSRTSNHGARVGTFRCWRPWLLLQGLIVLGALACSGDDLSNAEARVELDATSIHFGNTLVHSRESRTLTITNSGRQTATLDIDVQSPFVVDSNTIEIPGSESRELEITFAPTTPALIQRILKLSGTGHSFEIELSGFGVVGQECVSVHPCRLARFDPNLARCVEDLLDDVPCENACLTDAVCQQGECVGEPLDCTTGNRCLTGSCDPLSGCVVFDSTRAVCPDPINPCFASVCSESGCAQEPVPDGVACGPASCDSSFVCSSGVCVELEVEGGECPQQPLCTADGWCWENPLPQGVTVNKVASTDTVTWAVGDSGVVLRFENDRWSPVATNTTHDLLSIHLGTSGDVGPWVTGRRGTVLRWHNGAFLQVTPPSVHLDFTSVWIGESDEIFVGGHDGRIWRRENEAWVLDRAQPIGNRPKIVGKSIEDLWMIGSAQGSNHVYRRTENGWTSMWHDASVTTHDIHVIEEGIAVIGLRWDGHQNRQFILATDGTSLDAIEPPPLPTPPRSFLAGDRLNGLWTSGRLGMLRRFDGQKWHDVDSNQPQQLVSAHLRGDSGWAVGENGALSFLDSETWIPWSSRPDPRPQLLRSVWVDSSGSSWAVGTQGQVLRSDGKRWFKVNVPTSNNLNAVSGLQTEAGLHLWAAGDGGTVLRWDGSFFRSETLPDNYTGSLTSVWVAAPNRVWVVGDDGGAFWWDGNGWHNAGQGLSGRMTGVGGRAPGDAWLAGENGLWHWDGSALTEIDGPVRNGPILALSVTDESLFAVVEVGSGGTEVFGHLDGSWTSLPLLPSLRGDAPAPLRSIHAEVNGSLWAVSNDGVFHWSLARPAAWLHQNATNDLSGVFAHPETGAIVVGRSGSILRKQ